MNGSSQESLPAENQLACYHLTFTDQNGKVHARKLAFATSELNAVDALQIYRNRCYADIKDILDYRLVEERVLITK